MVLRRFDKIGSGYISDMTENFCTYEIKLVPISASGLQTFLDDGWVQQGEGIRLKHGSEELIYNFRKIQRS